MGLYEILTSCTLFAVFRVAWNWVGIACVDYRRMVCKCGEFWCKQACIVSSLSESVVMGYVRTFKKSGCTPNTALGSSIFETLAVTFYTASLALVVVRSGCQVGTPGSYSARIVSIAVGDIGTCKYCLCLRFLRSLVASLTSMPSAPLQIYLAPVRV